mmetsp:Transcript_91586/g.172489  ORF Transcript_91586/g.172489 Transcript_91586/m.172489 type:complete len:320 (-) Transcript_91586:201-1160(-)
MSVMKPQTAIPALGVSFDDLIRSLQDVPETARVPMPRWCKKEEQQPMTLPTPGVDGKLDVMDIAWLLTQPTSNGLGVSLGIEVDIAAALAKHSPPNFETDLQMVPTRGVKCSQGPGLAMSPSLEWQVPADFLPHATISRQASSGVDSSKSSSEGEDVDLIRGGRGNPEMTRVRAIAAAGGGLSGFTTVMIQQIPFEYTQVMFMNEINNAGFEGTYDFLSLPVNLRNSRNRGFGFVNFRSSRLAEEFYLAYQGQKLQHYGASQPLLLIPADVQGFERNVACFYASWEKRKNKHCKLVPFMACVRPDERGTPCSDESDGSF